MNKFHDEMFMEVIKRTTWVTEPQPEHSLAVEGQWRWKRF